MYTKKLVSKEKEGNTYTPKSLRGVCGGPFAQHWCIDFPLPATRQICLCDTSSRRCLVNLFLLKLVRISGFSSLSQRSHSLAECAENTAIAGKREENPETLTNLMRERSREGLARHGGVSLALGC